MKKYAMFILILLTCSACASQHIYLDDLYSQAKNAYANQEYDRARILYKKFVSDDPKHPLNDAALYYWADSARKSGRGQEAEDVDHHLINEYPGGFWSDLAQKDLDSTASKNDLKPQ